VRIIALVGVAGFMVGCAAHDQGAAKPAPTTSANAALVAPAVAGKVAPASSSGDQADTVDQKIVARGYRARHVNGQVLYCRSETPTGTRFSNTVCLTAAQISQVEQSTQTSIDSMNRSLRPACVSSCN
jgi:hypothetical protein